LAATSIDFGEVELMLRAYMAATGIQMSPVARRAVREYIESEIEQNPGVRERFEAAHVLLLAKAGGNIASIAPKRNTKLRKAQQGDSAIETKA
jgi:hypothetical protein